MHGAAHAHHLGTQRIRPPGKVRADIAHAHAQHPAARNAAHRVAGGCPAVLPLVIPVGGQLLEQAEPHCQHTLADGQTVSAGGIGHDALLRQHPRLQIVIGAGCVGLEPLQMIVLPDQRHRQVAQHRISPQGILHRGSIRGGKAICKALHRLNAGLLLCTDGQADKDMFGHNGVPFLFFVYHTANCAVVQGAVLCFQTHLVKEQCRAARKPPDTALYFSPVHGWRPPCNGTALPPLQTAPACPPAARHAGSRSGYR